MLPRHVQGVGLTSEHYVRRRVARSNGPQAPLTALHPDHLEAYFEGACLEYLDNAP